MQGCSERIWGKFRADRLGEPTAWHPLTAHSADVAACLEALAERPVLRGRLAAAGGLEDLDRSQLQRLAWLAAHHDVGKYNPGFQAKIRPEATTTAGHVSEAVALLQAQLPSPGDVLDLATVQSWCEPSETILDLLLAAFSHHGKPVTSASYAAKQVWEGSHGRAAVAASRELSRQARAWFPEAFAPSARPLPSLPAFQHAFNGLLMLADWLGSDDRFFPFAESSSEDRMPFARGRAAVALQAVGLDLTQATAVVAAGLPPFPSLLNGHEPNAVQQTVDRLQFGRGGPGGSLALIESDTGSGKTEAAFRYFLKLHRDGLVDGLYFALPTRSAARQIHGRLLRAARASFGENAPPVVLAVPGYLQVDESRGTRLPGFEVLWNDDATARMRYRGWAAENPKRFLAAPLVVGTIDQALLSCLTVPHAQLRASALMRQLLVVDEVHASDPYMSVLLDHVLDFHVGKTGGHALLMSATLGSGLRWRLVDSRRGPGPTLEDALSAPYPAVWLRRGPEPARTQPVEAGPERRRQVSLELQPHAVHPDEVAAVAGSLASRGARVLVIRNLVRDALATQAAVERLWPGGHPALFRVRGVPTLHHSRFAPEDRRLLDAELECRFGATGPGDAALVVATQTVEQSLDLDADALLTDLCPMDVLLQRLGRLHRHPARVRPPGFETARCTVLVPTAEGPPSLGSHLRQGGRASGPCGLGTVYPDLRVLAATWRLLAQKPLFRLPAMNRELVERATHPEVLDRLVEELGGRWSDHRNSMLGKTAGQRLVARGNVIDREQGFNGDPGPAFPDQGIGDLGTRLGEHDRRVELTPALSGPFGPPVSALTIPGYLTKDLPSDTEAADLATAPGSIRFGFGHLRFVYDRLGLRIEDGPAGEEV